MVKEIQIVAISDTHNKHDDILFNQWLNEIPDHENSMIMHSGDMSLRGTSREVQKFLEWYNSLRFKHKILIAGNHDWICEQKPDAMLEMLRGYPSIHYLNDSGVTLEGINIYGSPVSPWFHDWAFNRYRGEEIQKHWDLVPMNTDIFLTHGPAYLKGDMVYSGDRVGCEDLLKKIEEIKPKLHISGHIHEDYGEYRNGDTTFFNASSMNKQHEIVNKPLVYMYEYE